MTSMKNHAMFKIVIRLTEVELTTGSIAIREPTVWAEMLGMGRLFLFLEILYLQKRKRLIYPGSVKERRGENTWKW